jgi:hypothetical protein
VQKTGLQEDAQLSSEIFLHMVNTEQNEIKNNYCPTWCGQGFVSAINGHDGQ